MQHTNISRVSFSFTLMTVLFFLFSMPVFASCNHDWQLNYETCEDGTDGRHHVVSSHYTCENCGKQKTETTKSDDKKATMIQAALDEYSKGNIVMQPEGSFTKLLATKGIESLG